jgi:hypothetical protein
MTPDVEAEFEITTHYDLKSSFVMQRTGRNDPTARLEPARFAKASRTPLGMVAIELVHNVAAARMHVRAWGDGAAWAMERVPAWLGEGDGYGQFAPTGVVETWAAKHRGLRLPRSPFPTDLHISLVLQQRVTFSEAVGAHHRLAEQYGDRAPGPLGLLVFPDHDALRRIPSYDFRAMGIDSKRATALVEAARLRARVLALEKAPFEEVRRYLGLIPGTGPWTAENLLAGAYGDPDAVPPGDVHLPHQVCFALNGEAFGSDERMFELLEPYRGHRNRVVRLMWLAGPTRPYIDRARVRKRWVKD